MRCNRDADCHATASRIESVSEITGAKRKEAQNLQHRSFVARFDMGPGCRQVHHHRVKRQGARNVNEHGADQGNINA